MEKMEFHLLYSKNLKKNHYFAQKPSCGNVEIKVFGDRMAKWLKWKKKTKRNRKNKSLDNNGEKIMKVSKKTWRSERRKGGKKRKARRKKMLRNEEGIYA